MLRCINIHVSGTVQGVGFRPFVYRIAKQNLMCGWVLNSCDGVHIHVEGDDNLVECFLYDLESKAPVASNIVAIDICEVPFEDCKGFEIRESEHKDDEGKAAKKRTRISPDLATCPDCLRELFTTEDRRYHYPFINCTNCGPRFTIINQLPYDRPATSMREFEMCPQCSSEYKNPADRRFHAQPDACFECGPTLSLRVGEQVKVGLDRAKSDEILSKVANMLVDGKIVAIKGLGGYHLACDATNEDAVSTLRARKHRYGKPLAIMVRDVKCARRYCKVNDVERELLESSSSPIVLLERLGAKRAVANKDGFAVNDIIVDAAVDVADVDAANKTSDVTIDNTNLHQCISQIAPSVAGTLHELGVVLPYTPVQHLLMNLIDFPLVMTSGNFTEEPIVSKNNDAHKLLGKVADAFLDNNREIISRYDDSVVRVVDGHIQFVRRARGYAPAPLPFPNFMEVQDKIHPSLLATGPQQKNTFALLSGDTLNSEPEALVSQHIGDLENVETLDSWQATLELYKRMFDIEPSINVCDMHPEYMTTKWAASQATEYIQIQHHHAHIAATLAENIAAKKVEANTQVIGIALDGTGYGTDGTIWGGEIMVCNCANFERVAHLQTQTIVGSEQAIKHPSRLALALLQRDELLEHPGAIKLLNSIGSEKTSLLLQMQKQNINCIQTSSTGRFLDAMSALLGICLDASFDGEAPMLLEGAAYDSKTGEFMFDPESDEALKRYLCDDWNVGSFGFGDLDPCKIIHTTPIVKAVLDDIESNVDTSIISLRIHRALAYSIAQTCVQIREKHKHNHKQAHKYSNELTTVALSGGVFMNRILLKFTLGELTKSGFEVLQPRELPPNDGCISYGQLAVAAARLSQLL